MSQPPENSKLLVISFDDPLRAQEFLLAAARLQRDAELQLHDAVVVRRDADGTSHVTETTDITPSQAGVGAGVWGLLLGTLFGGPIGGLVVGAATAVTAALWQWGREQGAGRTCLTVLAENEPAVGLYARLGYWRHHDYHYRSEPQPEPQPAS